MKAKLFILPLFLTVTLFSCVSSKKFQALNTKYNDLNNSLIGAQNDLKVCRDEKSELERNKAIALAQLESQLAALKEQNEFLKKNNNTALKLFL
jgi:chemotaxis protein MotB